MILYSYVDAVKGMARLVPVGPKRPNGPGSRSFRPRSELFAAHGFASTTITAIAAKADVATETVYSRFGNKVTLLREILEVAIVGNARGVDILELPEIATIRALTEQQTQLAHLTHLSRGILERSALGHRILRNSGAADPALAEFVNADQQRRHRVQSAYIAMLLANGPLRDGLTAADAASTYGALANPDTYAFLIERRDGAPISTNPGSTTR